MGALIASMMALAVLPPELLWWASYFGRLLFGTRITELAGDEHRDRLHRELDAHSRRAARTHASLWRYR